MSFTTRQEDFADLIQERSIINYSIVASTTLIALQLQHKENLDCSNS